ncbi:hypothetical protein RRG08_044396 [Elysia crispata]|uniref:Uncharacterized protein n=1 Tax=Elysia crispata TaxID=231223 RepID=A0AAE1DMN7_9GAST|nr:hypothetical protein RRG08_044396 [Elysia crispata]
MNAWQKRLLTEQSDLDEGDQSSLDQLTTEQKSNDSDCQGERSLTERFIAKPSVNCCIKHVQPNERRNSLDHHQFR